MPAGYPGALFFATTNYLAADDSSAGNGLNNVSYRQINISMLGPASVSIGLVPGVATVRQKNALEAWRDAHADVVLQNYDVANDGRIVTACRVIPEAGQFRYEYAIYNLNSQRAVGALRIPLGGATVSDIDFHAVLSHSGEPYSNAPWTPAVSAAEIAWSTESFGVNPNANAIRWDTTYNFRFVSPLAPTSGPVLVSLFEPGTPSDFVVSLLTPSLSVLFARGDINEDGAVNIADPVVLLETLFVPGATSLTCDDAADANDDGARNIADAVALLQFLFVSGTPPLAAPSAACGLDPSADALTCDRFAACP
jgi:hypothetical protein